MQDENTPYEAPSSNLEDVDAAQSIEPANKGVRFANFIIDYISYLALSVVVGLVVGIGFGERGIAFIESIPDFLLGLPIFLTYYIFMEGVFGRTLGKLATGTKVVNLHGENPRFSQIVGRSICRLIPFEAFSFLGEQGRGWHDSIPKTYVIKCR